MIKICHSTLTTILITFSITIWKTIVQRVIKKKKGKNQMKRKSLHSLKENCRLKKFLNPANLNLKTSENKGYLNWKKIFQNVSQQKWPKKIFKKENFLNISAKKEILIRTLLVTRMRLTWKFWVMMNSLNWNKRFRNIWINFD